MNRRRWPSGLACAVLLLALAVPSAAHAEEQPAILKAYDLDWIERVRDDAWPQPKTQRPVICLLDTGVDITPDTPADDPNGPIVARLALDGGTGLAQGTTWEHQHGTQMASIIAAPRNGYGTVGVFPQARIVSIRVTDKTQDEVYITPGAVVQGVRACTRWASAEKLRVASIVMAESNYDQRTVDIDSWEDASVAASGANALFTAAAGNDSGANLVAPIAVEGILSVSAGDEQGRACSFVGPAAQPTALRGPGCAASGWIAGSSAATAVAGAFALALASRDPTASASSLRAAIRTSALPVAGASGRLSGALARESFGASVSDVANHDASGSGGVTSAALNTSEATEDRPPRAVLWKPKVRLRWARGRLFVTRVSGLDGELNIRLGRRPSDRIVSRRGRRFSVSVTSKPRIIEFWASASDGSWRSLSVRCRP